MEKRNKTAKEILIAPSWQKDNILSSCIEEILDSLDGLGYNIIVRPNPQFVRHEAGRLEQLRQKYQMDSTLKPALFINTPMKVMNEDYKELGITPIDVELRSEIGKSIDLDNLKALPEVVHELLSSSQFSSDSLKAIREKYIYNIGASSQAGGEYIIERLHYFEEKHKEEDD